MSADALDAAAKASELELIATAGGEIGDGPYAVRNEGFVFVNQSRQTVQETRLTNFIARIVEERIRDNGTDPPTTTYLIDGRLRGGMPLRPVEVPASRFASMSWVADAWGRRAIIAAGQLIKDRVREAIQAMPCVSQRRVIYEHAGWRRLEAGWRYLHTGGALGPEGNDDDVQVYLGEPPLDRLCLPDPPLGQARIDAVRTSLALANLGKDSPLGVVLLAAAYRAPLSAVAPVDFGVFVAGRTGTFKSESTALALAHFGNFDARHFPGSWCDTEGSLERKAHSYKDTVIVVDDFAPAGSAVDRARLNARADRLFRGAGNQSARGRLTQDIRQRATYVPRGLILSSGEDVPLGHSLRARMLVIEIEPGNVPSDRLKVLQRSARTGQFAAAMSGYIAWLSNRMDQLRRSVPERMRELREYYLDAAGSAHARHIDAIASLTAALELVLDYAFEVGALGLAECNQRKLDYRRVLLTLVESQGDLLRDSDEASRCMRLLEAALSAGRCHLKAAHPSGGGHACPDMPQIWGWRSEAALGNEVRWSPMGETVGWIEGENLMLLPDVVHAVVQRMAREQGGVFATSQRSLLKRLAEKGWIRTEYDGRSVRHTVRRQIGAERRRVIIMPCDLITNASAED